jgi:ATP-binding cassette subfamily B protein
LIICIILFSLNPGLAAVVLLPTPLLVVTTRIFSKWFHDVYHSLWRRWAGMSALLADTIPGVRVVKAFAQEKREVNKFERTSWDLLSGEIRAARVRSAFGPIMTFITSMGTLIVWWMGGMQVLGGSLTLGDFVAFTGYMFQFFHPVEHLCFLNHRFQRAATSAERVFEVLDTRADVVDKPDAVRMPRIVGRVEFRNVTFGYETGKPVLKDLSFVVEPGEMIGLAGHSGAGKSTLINLICRFYDGEEGDILIDGHDIRDVGLKPLREQIGVVLQDPFLFNGTVAENISYGKPDAPLDEVVAAAKAANAHDFIIGFPEGYDSLVGERGMRVSGGERQRLSIARAILRDPRILILDEATASVDTETEAAIQGALERLIKGRTTFAIAHRLSTLKNSSRLLILEKGELAEMGTHDELIEKDGIYANLCKMQTEMSKLRAW